MLKMDGLQDEAKSEPSRTALMADQKDIIEKMGGRGKRRSDSAERYRPARRTQLRSSLSNLDSPSTRSGKHEPNHGSPTPARRTHQPDFGRVTVAAASLQIDSIGK